MTDTFSKKQRSKIMSSVKSTNTGPEIIFRKALFSKGIRYRTNFRGVKGSPDIGLLKNKIAIFIDGCFWHKCPRCFRPPESNKEYWLKKVNKNKARDKKVNAELRNNGWKVIRIWEHEIRNSLDETVEKTAKKIKDYSKSSGE